MKRVLKTNQLCPDGVMIDVDLTFMCVGASFFIPCLDLPLAQQQAKDIGRQHGWKFNTRPVIEEGVQGIRVWRML